MKRYIAFLRGINISGKNKLPMAQLKTIFEELDCKEIKTYGNSGNVVFSSNQNNTDAFIGQIQYEIKKKFNLEIPIGVLSQEKLEHILLNAPDWWGNENKEIYDNLIFILPPTTFDEVFNELKEPKETLEKIANYKNVIFWSFIRNDYQKTNWWSKTASSQISNKLTIRTANTVKKLVKM